MYKDVDIIKLTLNSRVPMTVSLEIPNKCPICSVGYKDDPLIVYCISVDGASDSPKYAYAIYFCPHCENCFYVTYIEDTLSYHTEFISIQQFPVYIEKTPFNPSINNLSPQFVTIYNQAEVAEAHHLTEICGVGYRKALEFLIKDFAIHENPDDSKSIKSMQLSHCISKYIADPNIRTLSERSSWLGNDEAHYVRKQEAYDINDMKQFIQAAVYFISMILITEKASAIKPVR